MALRFTFFWSLFTLLCFTGNTTFASMTNSVTQWGITWTFDQDYQTGQFANGDYWVVGPVVITSISPMPSGDRNGSMVNPVPMSTQAYDSRIGNYNSTKLFTGGTVNPNSSVVSTISLEVGGSNREILKTAAVLTVLGSTPPNNGSTIFRPPYLGSNKPLYSTNDMDSGKLKSLPLVSSAPSSTSLAGRHNRLQLDHLSGIMSRGMLPVDNMASYGAANTRDYGINYLLLSSNYPLEYKIPLLINMVQIGIDYYQAVSLGQEWQTNGGHSSGHKMTILFAGYILNNSDMLNIMQTYGGNFAEDCQTFYTTSNPPTEWGTGIYETLDAKYGPIYARYGQRHCTNPTDPFYHGEVARGAGSTYSTYWGVNSSSWVGQTLAAHLYNLEDEWAHDAYFDHLDRYIETNGFSGTYTSSFSNEMWTAYRDNILLIDETSVIISPSTLNIEVGSTGSLNADVQPEDASNKSVTWSSDNTTVATVNASGVVYALSEGTAVITATTNNLGLTSTCEVTVSASSGDYNLAVGKQVTATAEQTPDNIGDKLVDNLTDDSSRWSAEGFPQSATIDLGVECNISSFEVYTYQSRAYQYVIEVSNDGLNYTQIVDRSSNTNTAQPISDNVITTGRYVKITVSSADGYTGTWVSLTELRVIGNISSGVIEPTSITVTPTILDLEIGATAQLTETVFPADADDKSVTWSSSNTLIATVDENGLVTAISTGNTTITVTTSNGSFNANCSVTVNEPVSEQSAYVTSNLPGKIEFENYDLGGEGVAYHDDQTKTLDASIRPDDYVDIETTSDIDGAYNLGYIANGEWLEYTIAEISGGEYTIDVRVASANPAPGNLIIYIGDAPDGTNLSQIASVPIATTGGWENWQTFTVTDISIEEGTNKVIRAEISGDGFDMNWFEFEMQIISVTGVTLNESSIAIEEGETANLLETISPIDATDKAVTWSTNDATIATVSDGVITAVSEGATTIFVVTSDGGYTATCDVVVSAPSAQSAYVSSSLPGIIEFENYDFGGEGVAYHDDQTKSLDASIRPDDYVDIEATSDVSGTNNVGWVSDGEWLEYTIAEISGGVYAIDVRAASANPAPGNLIIYIGDAPDGTNLSQIVSVPIATTGGWETWQTFTATDIPIDTGTNKVIRVEIDGDGFDMNWIEFELQSSDIINEDFAVSASNFNIISGGTWSVNNGAYELSNPASGATGFLGNMSIHNTGLDGDFVLTAMVKITGSAGSWDDAAVVFNYQDADNYYYVSLNESNDNNTQGIIKVENGTPTEIADISASITSDTYYSLQITRSGSGIDVELDGVQIASVTDATFFNGYVGFGTKNDAAVFDNLRVLGNAKSLTKTGFVNTIKASINVFPNPLSGDLLTINCPAIGKGKPVVVSVVDMMGKVVYNSPFINRNHAETIQINFNGLLQPGVYIVHVVSDNFKANKTLVVSK